jgi:hypothetical protein
MYRVFANFKPVSGPLPYRYFDQVSNIVWRARNLLVTRDDGHVEHMASLIDDMIDDYFEREREDARDQLISDEKYEYFEIDEDGNLGDIKSEYEDQLDCPTRENTREVDALAMVAGTWSKVFDDGSPDPEDYELFAALALAKIGEMINALDFEYDFKTHRFTKRDPATEASPRQYRRAAEAALEAMEAVMAGEGNRQSKRVEARHKKLLDEAKASVSAAVKQHIEEQVQAALEDDKRQAKEKARQNGRLAHRDLDAHKALILEDWAKNPSVHRSADRAARYYADWLKEAHGIQRTYEPRTISGWIRDYARANNIKLR